MIIHSEFRERFYNTILQSQNVVIVPYNDVDSLCATFILTRLFDADEIMYSVVPVTEWNQLKVVFDEHKQITNHFILLNCGGFRSLLEFDLPSSFCVFVLDARRPFHLDNVFNEETIRIVCQESEINDLNLPQVSEIYRGDEESDSSDEDGENEEDRVTSAIGRVESKLLKRKKMDAWRRKREEILWKYSHKSYISLPTSVFLLKIAHSMSKTSAASTWAAAVALSSLQVDHSISTTTYSTICIESMKPHLRLFGASDKRKVDPTLRITFEKDLTLPLYRHWTLDQSIRHDPFFVCAYRLWTQGGGKKLGEVYANLGIPLTECQNSFDKLDKTRRDEIFQTINDFMKTNYGVFFSHKGFAKWFSSADFARVIALKLQFSDPVKSHTELFSIALKFLSDFVDQDGGTSDHMTDSIKHYMSSLTWMTKLAYDCVQQKRYIQTPSFIGLTINHHTTELDYLSSSHCLNIFIYIAIRVFNGAKRSDGRLKKPFFLAVMNSGQSDEARYYMCSGTMPLGDILSDPERKSFIPRVFEEIAEEENLNVLYDTINPNVIMVREDSYADFFSQLDSKLPAVN